MKRGGRDYGIYGRFVIEFSGCLLGERGSWFLSAFYNFPILSLWGLFFLLWRRWLIGLGRRIYRSLQGTARNFPTMRCRIVVSLMSTAQLVVVALNFTPRWPFDEGEDSLFVAEDNNSNIDFSIDQTLSQSTPIVDQIASLFDPTISVSSDPATLFVDVDNGGDVLSGSENDELTTSLFPNDVVQHDAYEANDCASSLQNLRVLGKSRVRVRVRGLVASAPSSCDNPYKNNNINPIGDGGVSDENLGVPDLRDWFVWDQHRVEWLIQTSGAGNENRVCSYYSFFLLPLGVCSSENRNDRIRMSGARIYIPPRGTFDQYTVKHYTIGMSDLELFPNRPCCCGVDLRIHSSMIEVDLLLQASSARWLWVILSRSLARPLLLSVYSNPFGSPRGGGLCVVGTAAGVGRVIHASEIHMQDCYDGGDLFVWCGQSYDSMRLSDCLEISMCICKISSNDTNWRKFAVHSYFTRVFTDLVVDFVDDLIDDRYHWWLRWWICQESSVREVWNVK